MYLISIVNCTTQAYVNYTNYANYIIYINYAIYIKLH